MIANDARKIFRSARIQLIILLVILSRYFFTIVMRGWFLKLFLASRGYFSISIMADQNGFFLGEEKFIRSVLYNQNATVVDIGANFGDYSSVALDAGAEKVFLVEPNPVCFAALEKKFSGRIDTTLLNVAITNSNAMFSLQVPSSEAHGEGSLIPEVAAGLSNKPINYTVNGNRLENLSIPVQSARLIKIDVEGSEFEVLEQLSQIVGHKNKYIQFEFNQHHALVGTSITKIKLLFTDYDLMQMDLITGKLVNRNTNDPFNELFLPSIFVLVRNR